MAKALVAIIHIKMVELDVAKWVVTRSIKLNKVNTVKVARAVGLIKARVGLTFFIGDKSFDLFAVDIYHHKSC